MRWFGLALLSLAVAEGNAQMIHGCDLPRRWLVAAQDSQADGRVQIVVLGDSNAAQDTTGVQAGVWEWIDAAGRTAYASGVCGFGTNNGNGLYLGNMTGNTDGHRGSFSGGQSYINATAAHSSVEALIGDQSLAPINLTNKGVWVPAGSSMSPSSWTIIIPSARMNEAFTYTQRLYTGSGASIRIQARHESGVSPNFFTTYDDYTYPASSGLSRVTRSIPAATRITATGMQFRLHANGSGIVGGTGGAGALRMQVRYDDTPADTGYSSSLLYYGGSQSLWDCYDHLTDAPKTHESFWEDALLWADRTIVVVYFGMNDRNETGTSHGIGAANNTGAGFIDNYCAIVREVGTKYTAAGGDPNKLAFVLIPAHCTTTPGNLTGIWNALVAYFRDNDRSGAGLPASFPPSTVWRTAVAMPYELSSDAEFTSSGWWNGGDQAHLSTAGYEGYIGRALDTIRDTQAQTNLDAGG